MNGVRDLPLTVTLLLVSSKTEDATLCSRHPARPEGSTAPAWLASCAGTRPGPGRQGASTPGALPIPRGDIPKLSGVVFRRRRVQTRLTVLVRVAGCRVPGVAAGAPMTDRRRQAVAWSLAAPGRAVSVAEVCAVAAWSARVTGAWAAVAGSRAPDFVMCGTDPVSEQLAELELLLGEGPGHDVLAGAAPVLAADLAAGHPSGRWPAFTAEARQAGARALFAFPLTTGRERVGVLGLYRSSPGPLTSAQLAGCLVLSGAAACCSAKRDRLGSPATWRHTAPSSTRPRACSSRSSASPRRTRLPGSGPTHTHRAGTSATWPLTSSPAACDWTRARNGTAPPGLPDAAAPAMRRLCQVLARELCARIGASAAPLLRTARWPYNPLWATRAPLRRDRAPAGLGGGRRSDGRRSQIRSAGITSATCSVCASSFGRFFFQPACAPRRSTPQHSLQKTLRRRRGTVLASAQPVNDWAPCSAGAMLGR